MEMVRTCGNYEQQSINELHKSYSSS